MNLHELYAQVCAVRPDLAVKMFAQDLSVYQDDMLTEDGPIADAIVGKWVRALPHYTWLGHDGDPINGWKVRGVQDGENYELTIVMIDAKPNPIEALAAFYLESTQ